MIAEKTTRRQPKERDSNMELLRIVAMLLVMVLHADFVALSMPSVAACVVQPVSSFMRFLVESLTVVAVNVFVLLSGWYGIRPTLRKFSAFVFQTLFLVLTVYLLTWCLGRGAMPAGTGWLRVVTFQQYWFVQAYIVLFALSPLLNDFVEHRTGRELLALLGAFYAVQTVLGYLPYANVYGWYHDGYSPLSFMGLYLLARYVRLHATALHRQSAGCWLGVYLGLSVLSAAMAFGAAFMVRGGYFLMYFYSYNSPLVIAGALALVLAFSRLSFRSRAVNWVAASCFAAYVVHMHPSVRDDYMAVVRRWFLQQDTADFILHAGLLVAGLFTASVLWDKVRLRLWQLLVRGYERLQQRD